MAKRSSKRAKAETEGAAQAPAAGQRRFCKFRFVPAPVFKPGVGGERQRLILTNRSKWVNGSVIRYAFFPNSGMFKPWAGTDALKAQTRKAFEQWTRVGIGVKFEEVEDRGQAQVRVGFEDGDGHWSYVGRDVLNQGSDDRTLNLDPSDGIASGAYGVDVATHEIGHTLGFPHEHQNPNAGIVWDEEAVYRALAAPPNSWSRNDTFENIIRKIMPDRVQGSNWDPDSVMHYPFEPGLILKPQQYFATGLQPAGGLSARDREWVKTFYPPLTKKDEDELPLLETRRLSLAPGQQRNFVLKPKVTRKYEIRTFGTSDTVGVLNLREANGNERYLTGDDDSGEDRNMSIQRRLQSGLVYVLRLRLYYSSDAAETAVMWW